MVSRVNESRCKNARLDMDGIIKRFLAPYAWGIFRAIIFPPPHYRCSGRLSALECAERK